jgi:hypothetical protein
VDVVSRSPLVECFRQGGVPRDVRLLAVRGGLGLQIEDQLQVLITLLADGDEEVAAGARSAIEKIPPDTLATLRGNADLPAEVREFCANRDVALAARASGCAGAPVDIPGESTSAPAGSDDVPSDVVELAAAIEADPARRGAAQRLSVMSVADRMKVAFQGSREERSILVRDPNRLVSSAVLSSPKLTESEVEAIARMTNVAEDVLRTVGRNRLWIKNYPVVAALTRNPKTPVGISLTLLTRLTERDVKMLSTDRNVPEPVRLTARKLYANKQSRRD